MAKAKYNRYRDFDAFFAEKKREPLVMKIFGEEIKLPPSMPAIVVLKLTRLHKQYGDDAVIPQSELLEMAVSILGEETLQRLCAKGLDIEQLGEIIKWAFAEYTGGNLEAEEEDTEGGDKGN